jgi:protein TonB
MRSTSLERHLVGLASSLGGAAVLSALVLTLNGASARPAERLAKVDAELAVAPPPPPPSPTKEPPLARRAARPEAGPRAPRPTMGSELASLGGGLGLFEAPHDRELATQVLGGEPAQSEALVMTQETVDTQPKPAPGNRPPPVPKEAVDKRIRGHVVLRMVIDQDGAVQDARVLESNPQGLFDDAVLQVAPTWRFSPATYKGKPVTLRVDQTIRFDLG